MSKLTVLERWTDLGEKLMLAAAVGQSGQPTQWRCHLFKSPTTDPTDESAPALVEADYSGYASIAFSWTAIADPGGGGNWEVISSTVCTFLRTAGDTNNDIYGYYLTMENGGLIVSTDDILYYRFFHDGATPPNITLKAMTVPLVSQIRVVPRIGIVGYEDPDCP